MGKAIRSSVARYGLKSSLDHRGLGQIVVER